jgi:protein SCO1/2
MWNNRAMSNRYWISVAAIAAAAAIAGVYVARVVSRPAVPSLESGTSLPQPRALADFSLVDTQGSPASPAALRGHPTLVFFGFTHCPDVCPTTLALLASVQKQVAVPGLKVALISVDPERDTPEQLGKYISSFGGDLIGLTGTAPEIVKTSKSFGVAASRVELPGGGYTMDHSATVFALDSAARIIAVFTPPFNAAALTRDVARLAPALAGPRS